MKMPPRAMLRALVLTALTAVAGLAHANPIAAQDLEIEMDRERMVEFARAHIAINDARDEFHGAVARVHDPEGRILPREPKQRMAAIQYAFFQAGGVGPNLGRLGQALRKDGEKNQEMIAIFAAELKRLLGVIDRILADAESGAATLLNTLVAKSEGSASGSDAPASSASNEEAS